MGVGGDPDPRMTLTVLRRRDAHVTLPREFSRGSRVETRGPTGLRPIKPDPSFLISVFDSSVSSIEQRIRVPREYIHLYNGSLFFSWDLGSRDQQQNNKLR